MEYPFHSSHRNRDEEGNYEGGEEDYPPPFAIPPPRSSHSHYREDDSPPLVAHVHHRVPNYPPPPPLPFQLQEEEDFNNSGSSFHPPHQQQQQDMLSYGYPDPPQPWQQTTSSVQHVSHQHNNRPHLPSFLHHQDQTQPSSTHQDIIDSNKPTYRVFCKADTHYSLTIREGTVILAPSDHSDRFQHWYKDEKYSTRVKDHDGFPSFSLVNKATGLALKHSTGATHPVQLIPYNPDVLDESILWTLGKDLGEGFRTIRTVNNTHINVEVVDGDKHHGAIRDGTTVVIGEWKKRDNQKWKIIPYYNETSVVFVASPDMVESQDHDPLFVHHSGSPTTVLVAHRYRVTIMIGNNTQEPRQ